MRAYDDHLIEYFSRPGHRRKIGWRCTCDAMNHCRTVTAAFKQVAAHLEQSRVRWWETDLEKKLRPYI